MIPIPLPPQISPFLWSSTMRDNLCLLLSGAVMECLTHAAEGRKGLSGPTAGGCSSHSRRDVNGWRVCWWKTQWCECEQLEGVLVKSTVVWVWAAEGCAGEKHGDVGVSGMHTAETTRCREMNVARIASSLYVAETPAPSLRDSAIYILSGSSPIN